MDTELHTTIQTFACQIKGYKKLLQALATLCMSISLCEMIKDLRSSETSSQSAEACRLRRLFSNDPQTSYLPLDLVSPSEIGIMVEEYF